MAAIIVAICALIALALFDLLALRYGVDPGTAGAADRPTRVDVAARDRLAARVRECLDVIEGGHHVRGR